jgi:hypothetical protein
MMLQIFAGFPLLHQVEKVLVFDIAKDGIAQTTRFLSRWSDHGEKRLRNLQLLFRKYVHSYPDNDHEIPPLRRAEYATVKTRDSKIRNVPERTTAENLRIDSLPLPAVFSYRLFFIISIAPPTAPHTPVVILSLLT